MITLFPRAPRSVAPTSTRRSPKAKPCKTALTRQLCSRMRATFPKGAPRTSSWSSTASWSRPPLPKISCCVTHERQVDRTELYCADEIFLCGTGAQIAPVISVDHRPVGDGRVGPIVSRIQKLYFDVVRGKYVEYRDQWCTP